MIILSSTVYSFQVCLYNGLSTSVQHILQQRIIQKKSISTRAKVITCYCQLDILFSQIAVLRPFLNTIFHACIFLKTGSFLFSPKVSSKIVIDIFRPQETVYRVYHASSDSSVFIVILKNN